MKDCAGMELEIGQTVATNYNGYTDELVLCWVAAITPKKVRVVRLNSDDILYKFPKQLAIVRLA